MRFTLLRGVNLPGAFLRNNLEIFAMTKSIGRMEYEATNMFELIVEAYLNGHTPGQRERKYTLLAIAKQRGKMFALRNAVETEALKQTKPRPGGSRSRSIVGHRAPDMLASRWDKGPFRTPELK